MIPDNVTISHIETAIDQLSEIIVGMGERGKALIPIYKRMELELSNAMQEDDILHAIRRRVKQSNHRMEEQSF